MSQSHELNVQHHYRDMSQQHEAAKLGIWLFLATEVLLFGGLFCGYAVFRANHPDLFEWGEQFLDEFWGGLNTAVLLISSLTMAMAITFVQREKKRAAMISLFITLLCAVGFMVIKSIEYSHKFHDHLLGGMAFYQTGGHDDGHFEVAHVAISEADSAKGKVFWIAACRSCHGPAGEGVPGQGTVLNSSPYVHNHSDAELVAFIEKGRTATDAESKLKLEMPPKGGNPMLKEQDLYDIVAYLRSVQIEPTEVASHANANEPTATHASTETSDAPLIEDIPRSTIPLANNAPTGLAPRSESESERLAVFLPAAPHEKPEVPQLDQSRPANAHLFFGLYFYYSAVECGGLYWHIVDVIWIFLFPLWYLI